MVRSIMVSSINEPPRARPCAALPDPRRAHALHTPGFPARETSQWVWNIPDDKFPGACHGRQNAASAWNRPRLILRWQPKSVQGSIADGPKLTLGFLPASLPCSNDVESGSAARCAVVTDRGTHRPRFPTRECCDSRHRLDWDVA